MTRKFAVEVKGRKGVGHRIEEVTTTDWMYRGEWMDRRREEYERRGIHDR